MDNNRVVLEDAGSQQLVYKESQLTPTKKQAPADTGKKSRITFEESDEEMERSAESEVEVDEEEELIGHGGGISLSAESPINFSDDEEDDDFQSSPLSPVITQKVAEPPSGPMKKRGRPPTKKSTPKQAKPKSAGRKQRKRRRVSATQ